MFKLVTTFLGAAFAFLFTTSVMATPLAASDALHTADRVVTSTRMVDSSVPGNGLSSEGFSKTIFTVLGAEGRSTADGRSGRLSTSTVVDSTEQGTPNGLSMLVALMMIGGIVLRRFIR